MSEASFTIFHSTTVRKRIITSLFLATQRSAFLKKNILHALPWQTLRNVHFDIGTYVKLIVNGVKLQRQ